MSENDCEENDCDHQEHKEEWIVDPDDERDGRWESYTVSTTEDIDLHRYRCTQCGLVMYYSGAARSYYEKGVACDIPGLGG